MTSRGKPAGRVHRSSDAPTARAPGGARTIRRRFAEALDAVLREYPDAFVAAVGEDGVFVPIPSRSPLGRHRQLRVRSLLELVIPDDRELLLRTWERARATGGSTARIHLGLDPEHPAVVHFLDLRERHGAYVAVLVAPDAAIATGVEAVSPLAPRVARVRKNELAVFLGVDEATTQILGWSIDELVGHRSLEFIHPDDSERAIAAWMQLLSEPDRHQPPVRLRHRTKAGAWVWFEVTNRNQLGDAADPHVLAEMVDITDEMAAHEALATREQLLHRLAEALPLGVFEVLTDRRVSYMNGRLGAILGVPPAESADELFRTVAGDDQPRVVAALDAALSDGIDADLEIQVRPREDVRARRCMMRLRSLGSVGAVTGAVVCVEDVTESAQLRAELERRASHDPLTGLLNRGSVIAALERALVSTLGGTAVIFVDIDDFKSINDHLGHVAGDEVLRTVADRLVISVRSGDPVGRIGGDEFLVVCPAVGSSEVALGVADRIADALCQPMSVAGTTLPLRASVGVAVSRGHLRADLLVRRADAAMYESKHRAQGRPVLSEAGRRVVHAGQRVENAGKRAEPAGQRVVVTPR